MTKLAKQLQTKSRTKDHDWAKLGTSIVGIAENGIGALSKIFGG